MGGITLATSPWTTSAWSETAFTTAACAGTWAIKCSASTTGSGWAKTAWIDSTATTTTNTWAWADTTVKIWWDAYEECQPVVVNPASRLREIIRARQAPLYLPSHQRLLKPVSDERELRARATFRRIVGEHNWRTYCAKGYVSVRGKSGLVYQLFSGHSIARVYRDGQLIERLCIQLSGDYPSTDVILMRYVLVLSDEAEFRRVANKHSIGEPMVTVGVTAPMADLVTLWREMKRRYAA